jgi:hypothetical protein
MRLFFGQVKRQFPFDINFHGLSKRNSSTAYCDKVSYFPTTPSIFLMIASTHCTEAVRDQA